MFSVGAVLVLALLFYLLDFLAVLARRSHSGLYSLMIAGLLSIFASFSFSWFFITDNFALRAVYQQSSRSLSPLLKLSASWTGSGGSLLLWLFMMAVALLIFRLKNRRSMNGQQTVASLVMSFFTMTVLAFALATNPFSELGVSVPNGLGLNPSLQTFFSTIHPPLVFAAYSTLLLSYSLVLGRSWISKTDPYHLDERILWISWTLLTLGISIGGFWAYQTVGWGGYWAWDPLETSALIPWLALTALLFAKFIGYAGGYDLFAVTFSASSLILTVYIARSAAVPSVHAYGTFRGGDAILLLAIVPVLLSYMAARTRQTSQKDINSGGFPAALAFWSLILIAATDLIFLLCQSLGPAFGVIFNASRQLYNYASFPMLTVFLAVIFVKCVKEQPTYRDTISSFAFLFAIGFALSLLKYPTGNVLVSIGLPFIFGLLGTTTYRVLKWVLISRGHLHPYSDIKYLAFLGLAVLLLGVFVSSSMGASATVTVPVGESFSAFGSKLSVVQIVTFPSARQIFLPPYGMVPESIDSRITYTSSDEPSSLKVLFLKYYPALDRFVPPASIHSSFFEDTYIVASATESVRQATALAFKDGTAATPTDIKITVMRIPAVSLVWLGVAILSGANLPFILLVGTRAREKVNHHRMGNEA